MYLGKQNGCQNSVGCLQSALKNGAPVLVNCKLTKAGCLTRKYVVLKKSVVSELFVEANSCDLVLYIIGEILLEYQQV